MLAADPLQLLTDFAQIKMGFNLGPSLHIKRMTARQGMILLEFRLNPALSALRSSG